MEFGFLIRAARVNKKNDKDHENRTWYAHKFQVDQHFHIWINQLCWSTRQSNRFRKKLPYLEKIRKKQNHKTFEITWKKWKNPQNNLQKKNKNNILEMHWLSHALVQQYSSILQTQLVKAGSLHPGEAEVEQPAMILVTRKRVTVRTRDKKMWREKSPGKVGGERKKPPGLVMP